MSADVVSWISCELSKLLGTDADHTVARHTAFFLLLRFISCCVVTVTYQYSATGNEYKFIRPLELK